MYYDKPNINLLKETIQAIEKSGHSIEDIHHVIVKNKEDSFFNKTETPIATTWDAFVEMAKNLNYYNGYGNEAIWAYSRVVFKDRSFLERAEYDGSEWWRFVEIPDLNVPIVEYNKSIMSVNSYESDEEINRLKKKANAIQRKRDNEMIKEKLEVESKPFTLQDFIK